MTGATWSSLLNSTSNSTPSLAWNSTPNQCGLDVAFDVGFEFDVGFDVEIELISLAVSSVAFAPVVA